MPLARAVLRAYRWAKGSSGVVKYGAEMIESSVKMIARLIIRRLPTIKLVEFAWEQPVRFGTPDQASSPPSTPTLPNHNESALGDPQVHAEIIGGFPIPYEEGAAWLKREHSFKAKRPDDLNIPRYLSRVIRARDYPYDIDMVRTSDASRYQTLLVTQCALGPFVNVGPPGEDEVLQDDLKGLLEPGAREDEARDLMLRELGITTNKYRCYFSRNMRFTARSDNGSESIQNNGSDRDNEPHRDDAPMATTSSRP